MTKGFDPAAWIAEADRLGMAPSVCYRGGKRWLSAGVPIPPTGHDAIVGGSSANRKAVLDHLEAAGRTYEDPMPTA